MSTEKGISKSTLAWFTFILDDKRLHFHTWHPHACSSKWTNAWTSGLLHHL